MLSVIMHNVIMLNVTFKLFMVSVIKVNVVKVNVVTLIVVAPFVHCDSFFLNYLNYPARRYTTAKGGFLIIHA